MLKITTKSQIEKCQAGTKDDSEQKDEDLFVSPNNAKPHVLVAQLRYPQPVSETKSRIVFAVQHVCKGKKNTAKNYFSIFS